MWNDEYRWHFDYVRLAWDTGFSFEKLKYCNIDKIQISSVDIERIVKDRDFAAVERFIPLVAQYILEHDQAEVLDSNFVKIFRLSQLTVEYLLFCKRYLDNTTVLLKQKLSKLKDENEELQHFTAEMENQVSVLRKKVKQNENIVTFKCTKCNKMFSSEDYLNSHLKRRHSVPDQINDISRPDTDQLQSEIKHLKERLNNTEKLIQDQNISSPRISNEPIAHNKDEQSFTKEYEIQERFDRLKKQVESELNTLKLEKSFYEDKYDKWLGVISQSVNVKASVIQTNQLSESPDTSAQKKPSPNNMAKKIEITTQTDKKVASPKHLKPELVHNKNVFSFKDSSSETMVDEEKEDIIDNEANAKTESLPELTEHIQKFEESIENKVTSSLQKIEQQMQSFWSKLADMEMEIKQGETLSHLEIKEIINDDKKMQIQQVHSLIPKPVVKPRSRLTKTSKVTSEQQGQSEKIKDEIKKLQSKVTCQEVVLSEVCEPKTKSNQVKIVKPPEKMFTNESGSETETSSNSEVPDEIARPNTKPSASTLGKHSITSLRKVAEDGGVLEKFREEMETILNSRLKEMGISPYWKGIPQRTYEKAMDIVNHQNNLNKKGYKNFNQIRESIENTLMSKVKPKQKVKYTSSKKKISPKKVEAVATQHKFASPSHRNVINVSYRKKSQNSFSDDKDMKPSSTVTIKNRSMYDTDSESEPNPPLKILKAVTKTPKYTAVIEELQSLSPKPVTSDEDEAFSTKENPRKEAQTKSVLKNFPSVASLSKKKVIFDIDSDSGKNVCEDENKITLKNKDSGSTTSVASSVLDATPRENAKGEECKKDKEVESLSDFDFSEM